MKNLTTATILFEHFDRHRMLESPNHLDGSFGLETYELRGAEERERRRVSVHLFSGANEKQHGKSALLVVNEVLARFTRLARRPLSLPMEEFTADGVVLIHRAGRKLFLGFLKCNQS